MFGELLNLRERAVDECNLKSQTSRVTINHELHEHALHHIVNLKTASILSMLFTPLLHLPNFCFGVFDYDEVKGPLSRSS